MKNRDIFTTIFPCNKESKCQDFSGVDRQNYWSDKNEKVYVVTYYNFLKLHNFVANISVWVLLYTRKLKKNVS